jgi:hypothetical protein
MRIKSSKYEKDTLALFDVFLHEFTMKIRSKHVIDETGFGLVVYSFGLVLEYNIIVPAIEVSNEADYFSI